MTGAKVGGPNGHRVLLVDDEPDQLALLTTILERAGCTVIAVIDGEQALRLSASPVELAIIDLILPGIGGAAVAAALRAAQPGCRIVISSVLDASSYPGYDAELPKPFTRGQVLALLPTPESGC